MRYLIFTLILAIVPTISPAQNNNASGSFGFGVNSGMNGVLDPLRIVPSAIYTKGKNQLELGLGFNLFDRLSQKLYSTELAYKHFPNGLGNKYNMYFLTRLSYINQSIDTYYPTTYNYLFANCGYGFEVIPFGNVFMGTNLSVGIQTFNKNSEISYHGFKSSQLFDEVGFNMAFQFNVGYRF